MSDPAPVAPPTPAPVKEDLLAELAAHVKQAKLDIEAGTKQFDKLFPDWVAHLEEALKQFKIPAANLPAVEAEIKALAQEVLAFIAAKLDIPVAIASVLEAALLPLVEHVVDKQLQQFVAAVV